MKRTIIGFEKLKGETFNCIGYNWIINVQKSSLKDSCYFVFCTPSKLNDKKTPNFVRFYLDWEYDTAIMRVCDPYSDGAPANVWKRDVTVTVTNGHYKSKASFIQLMRVVMGDWAYGYISNDR